MLNLGIFVFGLAATGMVAVFTAITLRELRRLGAESDQRQAMAAAREGDLSPASVNSAHESALAAAVTS